MADEFGTRVLTCPGLDGKGRCGALGPTPLQKVVMKFAPPEAPAPAPGVEPAA